MAILTEEEFLRDPQRLLAVDVAECITIVDRNGEPLLLAVPLRGQPRLGDLLLDIATTLYRGKQVGLRAAAGIAGVSHSQMIDELSRRSIAVHELA